MNILKQKFITQRTGARNRGIDWHFTFEEWLEWWGDDIANRGNKSGQLVMARIGDQGPYHPNNVRKITSNENHKESCAKGLGWQKGMKHSEETCAKLSESSKRPRGPGIKRSPWSEERRNKMIAIWEAKKSALNNI